VLSKFDRVGFVLTPDTLHEIVCEMYRKIDRDEAAREALNKPEKF